MARAAENFDFTFAQGAAALCTLMLTSVPTWLASLLVRSPTQTFPCRQYPSGNRACITGLRYRKASSTHSSAGRNKRCSLSNFPIGFPAKSVVQAGLAPGIVVPLSISAISRPQHGGLLAQFASNAWRGSCPPMRKNPAPDFWSGLVSAFGWRTLLRKDILQKSLDLLE